MVATTSCAAPHLYGTSLLKALEALAHYCTGGTHDAEALEAALAAVEALCDARDATLVADERRRVKAMLASLWLGISKLAPATVKASAKARMREACTRALHIALGAGQVSGKMEVELAKAWAKTGREWLCARSPAKAVSCTDAALAHARAAPRSDKVAALVADCHGTGIEARWKGRSGALAYARSAGAALWGGGEAETERLLDLLYQMAEAAHADKRMGDCVDVISFALASSPAAAPLPPQVHARLLRLRAHAQLALLNAQAALAAVREANELNPTCTGAYLLCKCLLQTKRTEEATQVLAKVVGHRDFTARMAIGLSQALVQAELLDEAISVLRGLPTKTPGSNVKLFSLTCERDTAAAFDMLCQISAQHINGMQTLDDTELVVLYSTAFTAAQRLEGQASLVWMQKVADVIPPSNSVDKAKVMRCMAHAYLADDCYTEALGCASQAAVVDPDSAYTQYLLFVIHISLDNAAHAQDALHKLASVQDAAKGKLASGAAQHAYDKGYRVLAADALSVVSGAMEADAPTEERLQMLVNMLLCYEGGQEEAKVARTIRTAADLLTHAPPDDEELLWWKCKADEHKQFRVAADICGVVGDDEGAVYSMLRHCSVALDDAGSQSTVLADLDALGARLQGGAMPQVNKVYLLLLTKAKVAAGDVAGVRGLIEQLSQLPDVVQNDFEAVATMVAPGSPRSCPALYKEALRRVVQMSVPKVDADVPAYAVLMRRAMVEADGRDEQWEIAHGSRDTAVQWRHAYPAEEIEWLAAEAWNNGIYYHRLRCAEKGEGWMSLAHTLAALLPTCETRSEIETQFDTALSLRSRRA